MQDARLPFKDQLATSMPNVPGCEKVAVPPTHTTETRIGDVLGVSKPSDPPTPKANSPEATMFTGEPGKE